MQYYAGEANIRYKSRIRKAFELGTNTRSVDNYSYGFLYFLNRFSDWISSWLHFGSLTQNLEWVHQHSLNSISEVKNKAERYRVGGLKINTNYGKFNIGNSR